MLETKDPLCREQYNIYRDASKHKNLCVENNTIFTKMLENKRPFVVVVVVVVVVVGGGGGGGVA